MTGLRDRKREQSRAAAAEAAWRLFIDRGYDHVTVTDICTAADIAPRTFHRYFASKEDVVAEVVRRMTRVVVEHIAAAPSTIGNAEVLRAAMVELGRFVIAHRDRLLGLRAVVQQSQQLRATHVAVRPDQEAEIAALLAARHPGTVAYGWRLRLAVACATAAFRVWYDDYFRDSPADPIGHLDTILAATARPLSEPDRTTPSRPPPQPDHTTPSRPPPQPDHTAPGQPPAGR